MRMKLAWKKTSKQKDYIEIRPEAPGVWANDLINLIPIYCHHWDGGLWKVLVHQAWGHLAGVSNVLAGGAYNRVLNCGSPRPKEEVFKVFAPKRMDSLLHTTI